LNADLPAERPLIRILGSVQVDHGCGAATLLLRGRDNTELVFAAAQSGALPASLRDVRVFGSEPGLEPASELRRFRIEAATDDDAATGVAFSTEVLARSVQLHRSAAREFYGAVPPPRLPRLRRLGWPALLWALRVPGAARLLARLRGAR